MDTYISIDVECDGPLPGQNSLLSIGATAFLHDGTDLGDFYVTLKPTGVTDRDTMRFWSEFPDQYKQATENAIPPEEAMNKFKDWLVHKPVAVCSGFDYTWIYWYFQKYQQYCPFGYISLDPITYAKCLFNKSWQKSRKRYWPWEGPTHTHNALDDAREQAYYMKMMFKERDAFDNAIKLLRDIRSW